MVTSTARVVTVSLTAAILSVHIAAGAADNWPQFRGSRRRRRGRRSRVARYVERDPERRLEDRRARARVELADRVGRSHLRDGRRQHQGHEEPLKPVPNYTSRSLGGPMTGRDIDSSADPHRWVVYDIDFKTGRMRWEARSDGRARRAHTSEEQLRVGNACHRWRARLRVLRQRGPVRLRHEREAALVEADGAVQGAYGLGLGGVAGRPQRPRLHRQRQ